MTVLLLTGSRKAVLTSGKRKLYLEDVGSVAVGAGQSGASNDRVAIVVRSPRIGNVGLHLDELAALELAELLLKFAPRAAMSAATVDLLEDALESLHLAVANCRLDLKTKERTP